MATSGDQNPKLHGTATPQFILSDMFENSRCSVFSRGRFSELSNSALSYLFLLEMFYFLKTVCMQMAAAGLLHISELTFCGLNISLKLRRFLVFINLLAPEFYI
jgi:hypothetical protein